MAVSRNQLVLGLVIVCLVVPGLSAMAALDNGCLACHAPHQAGQDNCVFCHAGNPGTERKDIAHYRLIEARFAGFRQPLSPARQRGKQLVKELGCRRCHRIGGKGNRLATDLDRLAKRVTAQMREQALKEPARYMPNFRLEAADRAAIVTYLLAARQTVKPGDTTPRVVHFATRNRPGRSFDKFCASCHQLLSARWGAIGRGRTAPNLSGLFSPFYPTPPRPGERWTRDNLRKWIKNPRSFRPFATMPPLTLKKEELESLFSALRYAGGPEKLAISTPHP